MVDEAKAIEGGVGRKKKPVQSPPQPKVKWRLELSIWAPRKRWCDSRDFFDTEGTEMQMFLRDWEEVAAI